MTEINIAREFSTVPGPRFRDEGPHSGQAFRDDLLLPRFKQASAAGEQLVVYLDGVKFGYPTSFLEESFGGLARAVGIDAARQGLSLVANDEPLLVREIEGYIRDAHKTSPERLVHR